MSCSRTLLSSVVCSNGSLPAILLESVVECFEDE